MKKSPTTPATTPRRRYAKPQPLTPEGEAAIVALFGEKPQRLLAESTVAEVAKAKLGERDLLQRAQVVTGLDLGAYVRRALLAMARRDLAQDAVRRALPPDTPARGVMGASAERIEAAYHELVRMGLPVTPARLKHRAKAAFGTCQLWMVRKGLLVA